MNIFYKHAFVAAWRPRRFPKAVVKRSDRITLSAVFEGRNGFTLTELLAAVAVVGILAALLLPVGKNAVAGGKSTQCLSNLRQLAVATKAYAADNNDEIPYANYYNEVDTRWHTKLAPYLDVKLAPDNALPSGPFRCPSSQALSSPSSRSHYGKNYYMNGQHGGPAQNPKTVNMRFVSLSEPSKYYYLADSAPNSMGFAGREIGSGTTSAALKSKYGIQARHQDRANVLFMDFHVESVKLDDVSAPLYGQPPWNPNP